jgi:hypothetical protein
MQKSGAMQGPSNDVGAGKVQPSSPREVRVNSSGRNHAANAQRQQPMQSSNKQPQR